MSFVIVAPLFKVNLWLDLRIKEQWRSTTFGAAENQEPWESGFEVIYIYIIYIYNMIYIYIYMS